MKVTERGIALLFILRMPAQSDQGEAEAWSWNSSWTFPSGGPLPTAFLVLQQESSPQAG